MMTALFFRKEYCKISTPEKLTLPFFCKDLQSLIPHRPPMVWVEKVLKVEDNGGQCSVVLDPQGYAFSDGRIRSATLIEWVAQSYAFISAARHVLQGKDRNEKLKEAYLVAVDEADLLGQNFEETLVRVRVVEKRKLGPVSMIEGTVIGSKDQKLGMARLKVYAAGS